MTHHLLGTMPLPEPIMVEMSDATGRHWDTKSHVIFL